QPTVGPTLPSQLPTGPGRAHANVLPPVDGNGGSTTQFSTTVDFLVFPQHPVYHPNGDAGTTLRPQPPTIDPVLGKPVVPQSAASLSGGNVQQAAPPAGADPENGNLTVTAAGDIPSL